MTERKVAAPAHKVELYMRLLHTVREIDSKSNSGSAYTAINGNMYTMISKFPITSSRKTEVLTPYLESNLRYVKEMKPKPAKPKREG